jgi:hypothetical protein
VTEVERLARETGIALGDCGGQPDSPVVDEVGAILAELVTEPAGENRRRRVQARIVGPRPTSG